MANRSGQGKKRKPAGLQPLKTGASGLALVANRRVTMINARWNELATPGKGGWEREDGPARRRHGDLRLLVLDEAARLPMRGGASAVRRFRRVGGDDQVLEVRLERLNGAGELVLADTIGAATPRRVRRLVERVSILGKPVGAHLHNTRNTGYACAWGALDGGATVLDASIGGLGGCPFSPQATGNVATEDLVWQLERERVRTGIDVDALVAISRWLEELLGRRLEGSLYRAASWPA